MPSPQPFLHLGFLLCLVWEALTASSPSPALSLSACVLRSQVLRPPSQSWERRPLLSFSFRTWATKKEATCPERITFQPSCCDSGKQGRISVTAASPTQGLKQTP